MAARITHADEAYWRLNNFRTEVTRTERGYNVHFFCCARDVLVECDPDAPITGEIAECLGRTSVQHIERPCPAQATPSAAALEPISFSGQTIATTMADLVSVRQLVAIRAIANAHGLNAERVCREQLKCMPEELSRRAASALIDYLKAQSPRERACA